MFFAQPAAGTDEGTETRWMTAGLGHRRETGGRHAAFLRSIGDGGNRRLRRFVADRRRLAHQCLFFGALDQPQPVGDARNIGPSGVHLALQLRGEAEAQAGCPGFQADALAGKPDLPEHPRRHVGRGLAVGMAAELCASDLFFDRDALHGAGDEDGFARDRQDQEMRREITPVIEAGQIEHILGACEDRRIELQALKLRPHTCEALVDFTGAERIGVHVSR